MHAPYHNKTFQKGYKIWDGYIFFIVICGWVKENIDFLVLGSAKMLPGETFFSRPPPPPPPRHK